MKSTLLSNKMDNSSKQSSNHSERKFQKKDIGIDQKKLQNSTKNSLSQIIYFMKKKFPDQLSEKETYQKQKSQQFKVFFSPHNSKFQEKTFSNYNPIKFLKFTENNFTRPYSEKHFVNLVNKTFKKSFNKTRIINSHMLNNKQNFAVVGQNIDLDLQKKYKEILSQIYKNPSKRKIINSVSNLLNDFASRNPIYQEILSEFSSILSSIVNDKKYSKLFENQSNSIIKSKLFTYKELTKQHFNLNDKLKIINSNLGDEYRQKFIQYEKINKELNLSNFQKSSSN